ncbi:MAG TPA: hypothetical protein DDW17_09805 [Deltaproteobacteria bacterium]|nr:hypothetical protein [Deltaproteobacteria bacterium]
MQRHFFYLLYNLLIIINLYYIIFSLLVKKKMKFKVIFLKDYAHNIKIYNNYNYLGKTLNFVKEFKVRFKVLPEKFKL